MDKEEEQDYLPVCQDIVKMRSVCSGSMPQTNQSPVPTTRPSKYGRETWMMTSDLLFTLSSSRPLYGLCKLYKTPSFFYELTKRPNSINIYDISALQSLIDHTYQHEYINIPKIQSINHIHLRPIYALHFTPQSSLFYTVNIIYIKSFIIYLIYKLKLSIGWRT